MLNEADMDTARSVHRGAGDDLCVLVVEDSEADAYLIHRALFGHPAVRRVVHAHDGLEARAMIESGEVLPDLAFIDLQMPRLNGFDLLVALACGSQPHFPMIVLTSSSLEADGLRSRIRGADRVITKPNTIEALGVMLTAAVDAVCEDAAGCKFGRDPPLASPKALSEEIASLKALGVQAESWRRTSARSAAALRSAARIAQVGGWEMDFSAELMSLSPELCDLLGSPARELPLSESLQLWVAADRPAFVEALDQVIANGCPLVFEGRSTAPDGSVKWWRMLGEPDLAEDRCLTIRGAAQDVTDWRASGARAHAADLAAGAMLSFVARMSHEIRTPLNGVVGMAELLAKSHLSKLQRRHLDVIDRSGAALLALFDDLLDLSRLAAGELELECGGVDAQALADSAQAAFFDLAKNRKLGFRLKLAPSALGQWTGDAHRLGQVLKTLISNAVKFTDHGSVSVEISRAETDLTIVVRDTGIGIAPDRLPHIFERFVQADGSATRRHGGLGAGLTICRELLTLMGGRITADSVEGEGAVVTVTVPVDRYDQPKSGSSARQSAPVTKRRALHVLVAEDSPANQLRVGNFLCSVGIHPVIVANGWDAFKAWRRGDWDIVLMDIKMPVMDGLTAVGAIRLAERELGRQRTPIFAVTSNPTQELQLEYLAAGMDGLVAKPVDLSLLLVTIDDAIRETVAT